MKTLTRATLVIAVILSMAATSGCSKFGRSKGQSTEFATFIKAYTNIKSFRGMSSFLTWLMRIAFNVHYDYRRKQKTNVDSVERVEETYTPNSSLKMDIYHALSLLKDEERVCITLQLIDGQPIDQISAITGIGENTVKSHLRRGKEKLANYLKANGYDR